MPSVLFFVLLLVLSVTLCNGSSSTATKTSDTETIENNTVQIPTDDTLFDLSNAELESICTSRGFELKRDSTDTDNGDVVYTHTDYVDAARQCLAIEAEMEQAMKDNPEIMEELKLEAERLIAEKARLEELLAATNAELGKGGGSDAFITPGASSTEKGGAATVSNDAPAMQEKEPIDMGDDDFLDFDLVDKKEEPQQVETPPRPADSDEQIGRNDNNDEDNASEPTLPESNEIPEETQYQDLSMGAFARETFVEFRDQIERDLERIFPKEVRDRIMKALRPVIKMAVRMGSDTFDMLKRYLIALLDRAGDANKTPTEKVVDELRGLQN